MTDEQKIRRALADIEMAESHISEAGKMYYKARKRLESVYSPTAPKRENKLSNGQIARVVAKRINNVKKQTNAR